MAPVLRISGRGAVQIVLQGLTSAETAGLTNIIGTSGTGAGSIPAPVAVSARTSDKLTLSGTPEQLKRLSSLLNSDTRFPAAISRKLNSLLDNYLRSDYKIDCRGKVLDLGSRTHIMGILNVTPDSFSDGGQYADPEKALAHAREMAAAGADIIDIGGESTRPGAEAVSEEEELRRIIPLIERLAPELSVPLSVDTYKSSVARKALQAGAGIVNDIGGLRFSPDMAAVAAEYGAAVVIMHIQGTPRNMQQNPVYDDVIGEISAYLEASIGIAVRAGVSRERILIDPGIGFGKTLAHNLTILDRLDEFRALGRPIVLGTSRKKFIGTVLDIPEAADRVDGTAATVAIGIDRGARIVRVHDVARMAQVVRMTDAIVRQGQ